MQPITIKKEIPEHVKTEISRVIMPLVQKGFECYLIGGSVRDLMLSTEPEEFDFATNAHPRDVMKTFSRVAPTGIKHGTVSVLIEDNVYEVTTYRSDGKYIDGRRPESVAFSRSLEEDVMRRDFTINGLAYDLINDQVIDYVGGLCDIEKKIIRTIGNPLDRFGEDGLRPYRACRIAAKLEFDIEQTSFDSINSTLDIAAMVSVERVRDELKKMLAARKPSIGFEYLRKSGLLVLSIPELMACFEVQQNRFHLHDVYYHSVYACDAAPQSDVFLRLAALLHDVGKVPTRREGADGDYTFYNHEVVGSRMASKIMKRLKFSNEEITRVTNLVSNHMFHYTEDWTDGAVRRFMRKIGVENMDDLFMLRLADRVGNGLREGLPAPIRKLARRVDHIIEEENAITVKDLNINGNIIMDEFNITPGPVIGKILNELLEMVLDDPALNTHETLLSHAREIYSRLAS